MKAEFSRWGPVKNYTGAQVSMSYNGRKWLGEIRGIYRNETLGSWFAQVFHFDGSKWPFDPALAALDILERDYWKQREQ